MPWVILGRVIRGDPGAAAFTAAVGLGGAQEQHAAAAYEPDFITAPILQPPGVTILAAGRGAQPNADAPDRLPYIIATSRFCILAHFYGAYIGDNPQLQSRCHAK